MKKKHVRFDLVENAPDGTSVFNVYNIYDGTLLATIEWFDKWKKYCLFPYEDTAWEVECLTEVINYINELMKYLKKSKRTKKDRRKTLDNIVKRGHG